MSIDMSLRKVSIDIHDDRPLTVVGKPPATRSKVLLMVHLHRPT